MNSRKRNKVPRQGAFSPHVRSRPLRRPMFFSLTEVNVPGQARGVLHKKRPPARGVSTGGLWDRECSCNPQLLKLLSFFEKIQSPKKVPKSNNARAIQKPQPKRKPKQTEIVQNDSAILIPPTSFTASGWYPKNHEIFSSSDKQLHHHSWNRENWDTSSYRRIHCSNRNKSTARPRMSKHTWPSDAGPICEISLYR